MVRSPLNDTGIISNSLKIKAAIENARIILSIQKEFDSFEKWLEYHIQNPWASG
jgi:DNA-3-methyladenine glycosylase I